MTDSAATLNLALAGRYTVEREIGAGGMATVYLAHDLKHDRPVAIKVLHPDLGATLGGDRFLSEIRTTARLQHPHILPLLDSGDANGLLYYVMPLVTGETLRARLQREKQLPIEDAVAIAREVSDVLGYAHAHDVIHRDIKPENILLQDGHALVADFGIALAVQTASGPRMTQTGLSLGTPQYMSPEQAMGERAIDARSDIYSLGAVCYEMLTGDAPFSGNTVQAIVAKVLTERPTAPSTVRDTVPANVEAAVMKALAKLPADRFADAASFSRALTQPATSAATHGFAAPVERGGRWTPARLAAAGIVVLLAGAAAGRYLPGGSIAGPTFNELTITQLVPPPGRFWKRTAEEFELSPDGRTLAVIEGPSPDGPGHLVLRRLDRYEGESIPDTEGATEPFWSPDSKSVAFFANGVLRRLDIATGNSRTICAVGSSVGGSWGSKGDILFSTIPSSAVIMHARADGNECKPLTVRTAEPMARVRPIFFGDGTHYLIASLNYSYLARLGSDATTRLEVGRGSRGIVARPDMVLALNDRAALLAYRIDLGTGKIIGTPQTVLPIVSTPWGVAAVSVSDNGLLVVAGPGELPSKAVYVGDRTTKGLDSITFPSQTTWLARVSRDGKTLALSGFEVRLMDIASHTIKELPVAPGRGVVTVYPPVWSAGDTTLFMNDLWNGPSLSVSLHDEHWTADALPLRLKGRLGHIADVSPDGKSVLFEVVPADPMARDEIWVQRPDSGEAHRLFDDQHDVREPRISPDGRWLAYSVHTDADWQVFVRPFSAPGAAVRVSRNGGRRPAWRADSHELFFMNNDRKVMAVAIDATGRPAEPVIAFEHAVLTNGDLQSFDVDPSGRRFYALVGTGGAIGLSVLNRWQLATAAPSKRK